MKIGMLLFFVLTFFMLLAACSSTGWPEAYKRDYIQTCLQDATQFAPHEEQAKQYCACALDTLIQHYPTMDEVIANKDSMAVRAALLYCRSQAMEK
jgi:hypothetical protein